MLNKHVVLLFQEITQISFTFESRPLRASFKSVRGFGLRPDDADRADTPDRRRDGRTRCWLQVQIHTSSGQQHFQRELLNAQQVMFAFFGTDLL